MKLKIFVGIIIGCVSLYGLLVFLSQKRFDVEWGISFNQNHATSLGLDWKEVYSETLRDLKPQHIRIAAMWSEVEKVKGVYNFDDVDWMMHEANKYGTKVTLVVGQKAPRWPECHVPNWLTFDEQETEKHLFSYVENTVKRYKDHPALNIWQVENEAFINFTFGECEGFVKSVIYNEIDIVKKVDTKHKIVITDSGELSFWNKAAHAGDYFGSTLYRIVRLPKGKIFTYDWLPAGFYRAKAWILGINSERFFISELQAEPWFTSVSIQKTSIKEQEETMNIERLHQHLEYSQHVGASRVYLWGVEWWYWMRHANGDDRYWEEVKKQLITSN